MTRATPITSARNPLLKEIRRALSKGTLTEDGLCVAETFHLLEEALGSGLETPTVVAAESVCEKVERQIGHLRGTRLITVTDAVYREISATEAAQGVLALVRPARWTLEQILRARALVVVLDGVQDPGNAGAITRAAEAFGATGMLWLKGTASPWNAKTLRASAGSLFRLPLIDSLEAAAVRTALIQHRLAAYTTVPRGGLALHSADLTSPCALIIGSEGRGLSVAMRGAGQDLHIPTAGVESLNASIAAAVVLYEASRQRALK